MVYDRKLDLVCTSERSKLKIPFFFYNQEKCGFLRFLTKFIFFIIQKQTLQITSIV